MSDVTHYPPFNPGYCVNCDAPCPNPRKLYCSDACHDTAVTIRYARRVKQDGRINRPDVQEAIQLRIGLILGGGYPVQERRIPPEVRQAVIERDGGRCQKCGTPTTEVDHIAGSSSALDNLQLLCHKCNVAKAWATATPATAEQLKMVAAIQRRIDAPVPERLCDDQDNWQKIEPSLRGEAARSARVWEQEQESDSYGDNPQDQEELEYHWYLQDLAARDD